MTQPYVDCARRLAEKGVRAEEVVEVILRGRGRHGAPALGAARRQAAPAQRLLRQVQPALLHRRRIRPGPCRLEAFTEERVRDERLRSLAAKGRYEIDPGQSVSGRIHRSRARALKDGRTLEERQGHCAVAGTSRCRAPTSRRNSPQLRARRLAEGAHREPSAVGREKPLTTKSI